MAVKYHKNQSVSTHQFAMVPKPDIPRSSFLKQHTHKTTFDADFLIPVFVDEVLPGDMFQLRMTAFARLATPIYPIMDNMYLDSFFFFVPCRLVWDNFQRFMGEQVSPGASTDFAVPVARGPVAGYEPNSIFDYYGLPTKHDVAASFDVNALPMRAYNLIFNEWFRDQNLQSPAQVPTGDGPDDAATVYGLAKRGKRHDYFTAALPFLQKGPAVGLPIGTIAPVYSGATEHNYGPTGIKFRSLTDNNPPPESFAGFHPTNGALMFDNNTASFVGVSSVYPSNLYADLSAATAATVNQLRQSFQIQRLLERDARGGTRYTELVRAHFGVISPDARLQRPEYLGGGTVPVNVSPIAQTSASAIQGSSTPLGEMGAFATLLAQGHGFTQSFTEHGYIIGIVNVRADLTYQQGLRKMWSRKTRYDFYFPAFAMLGEQAVLNKEIYMKGVAEDDNVFGYQERWAEYRYHPSMVTGQLRSTYTQPLDAWHLAEKFTALPTLNAEFIKSNTPISRVIAVDSPGSQFIFDSFFNVKVTRPMPMYSVPGMIDHF